MKVSEVLGKFSLGNSVAEFDELLEDYFIETEPFNALINDRVDIIAGDKGTGKTAIYKAIQKKYSSIKELDGIEVIPGFNITGSPIFQRLTRESAMTEAQYSSLWKAYILSLVGNWIIAVFGADTNEYIKKLDEVLTQTGLKSMDETPSTVFSKIMNTIRKAFNPSSTEVTFTFSETGIPIVSQKLYYEEKEKITKEIPHEEALLLVNKCLESLDWSVWVVLDRLDEAFQGFPLIEIPALRALFRTYLDMNEFSRIRIKLFVRRDLFRKVTKGGFVNLTHINSRKIEIIWDDEDILNLLCKRIRENRKILALPDDRRLTDSELFYRLFPSQIDTGDRKPETWNWIMSRIRDSNDVKPPRNIIDLINKAREAQIRKEERSERVYGATEPLIEADSIKKGLERLSSDRVEDTLLAEAADYAEYIEKFRGNKSEYDLDSICKLFKLPKEKTSQIIKELSDLGFLESLGTTYKIPMLYRDGLSIVQGKAF